MMRPLSLLLLLASFACAASPFKKNRHFNDPASSEKFHHFKANDASRHVFRDSHDTVGPPIHGKRGNLTLRPLKKNPRPFQFLLTDEFHIRAKKAIVGDTADDVQKAIDTTKDIIDDITPFLSLLDFIPGVGEFTSIMEAGSELLGLFGKTASQPDDTEQIQELRQQLSQEFAEVNSKLNDIFNSIEALSAQLDSLYAQNEFFNAVQVPLHRLMIAHQTYLGSPSNYSRNLLVSECTRDSPLFIFSGLEDVLSEGYISKLLEPSHYDANTFAEINAHILYHLSNAIFLNGVCLQLNKPDVTPSDFTEASQQALIAFDQWNVAATNFSDWAYDNVVVPRVDGTINDLWNDSYISTIVDAIQEVLDANNYWAEGFQSLINRNTETIAALAYRTVWQETYDDVPYQIAIFTRFTDTDCTVPSFSESDISDDARAGGWDGIAQAIVNIVENACQGNSVAVRASDTDIAKSSAFQLQDDVQNFLGYDYFAIYTY